MPAYKHWLIDRCLGDSFESLLQWEEIRVLIILWKRPEGGKKLFSRQPSSWQNLYHQIKAKKVSCKHVYAESPTMGLQNLLRSYLQLPIAVFVV